MVRKKRKRRGKRKKRKKKEKKGKKRKKGEFNSVRSYMGLEDEALRQELDEHLLTKYGNTLIDALFILSLKGVLQVVGNDVLYRGVPGDFDMTKNLRDRWTAFASMTRSYDVALEFSHQDPKNVLSLDPVAILWRFPFHFNIASLSKFPEEEEVLRLPGISLTQKPWGANNQLFVIRYQRAKRLVELFPREERDRESLYFDLRPREESPREGEREPSSQCCIA